MPNKSKLQGLINKLGGDETFTTRINKEKESNHVKDNIPLIADANMMCDTLHLPETTKPKGYKYLFVIVDLATDEFDMEPMKELNSTETLKALRQCAKRPYIKMPEYSLKTDGGQEFKGVFDKYLYDQSILHKGIVGHRHTSMGNVESLNRQLARMFNLYMNKHEEKTGKVFRNWIEAIDTIREDLNEYRKKILPKNVNSYVMAQPKDYKTIEVEKEIIEMKGKRKVTKTVIEEENVPIKPKFKVGQYVYRYLDHPRTALGKNTSTPNFREADITWDKKPRKITQVFTYGQTGPLYRYYLEGLKNASFTERQLKRAPDEDDE